MKDFAKALSLADKVVLADIYAARETDTLGISSETLQKRSGHWAMNVTIFLLLMRLKTFY